MQREITQPGTLLDPQGRLTQVGWSRFLSNNDGAARDPHWIVHSIQLPLQSDSCTLRRLTETDWISTIPATPALQNDAEYKNFARRKWDFAALSSDAALNNLPFNKNVGEPRTLSERASAETRTSAWNIIRLSSY
jgi:hypothetical protein